MKTQKPFVDVFKHFDIFKNVNKRGNVNDFFEKSIGKRVF